MKKLGTLAGHGLLLLVSTASAAAVLFILIYIFREALPFFREAGSLELFSSTEWYPTHAEPSFGALGIFVASALVIAGSCLLALPMGIAAAVCLSDVAPWKVRQVVKPVVELLAAMPSVAFGFFALVIFAPVLQDYGGALLAVALWLVGAPLLGVLAVVFSDVLTGPLPDRVRSGARAALGAALAVGAFLALYRLGARVADLRVTNGVNALNASIILAIMAIPTVVSVCEDALTAVGRELREGSYALGATRAETIVKVVIPAGKGGILAAVALGIMRAAGETMVVLMAAGNAIEIPEPWYNLLEPVRPLTATIALEMGETAHDTTHYHALFALAFCLLVFSFLLNLVGEWAVRRTVPSGG